MQDVKAKPIIRRPGTRRGNTLVLVAGILVLLVIIAAAYITRTQSGRVTSVAEQTSAQRDTSAEVIAEGLSRIPAEALFVSDVDWSKRLFNEFTETAGSNTLRLPVKDSFDQRRFGIDENLSYNFAPHNTVPFTNWPDPDINHPLYFNPDNWPKGPGNLAADPLNMDRLLFGESNPVGNPGFGDTRWLRDLEPLRWDVSQDGVSDRFTLWRHLSYVGTPTNGWRVCRDISDVLGDGNEPGVFGGPLVDLSLPVEQWLPMFPEEVSDSHADTIYDNLFHLRWQLRFAGDNALAAVGAAGGDYSSAYHWTPFWIAANYYRMKDVNPADFTVLGNGERPQDEFTRGTMRWNVSRILTDTDGDGYTDSFWWVPPVPVQRGLRHVVGVSIIDNSAMLNANVATRSFHNDYATNNRTRTRGWTPTDLALTSELTVDGAGTDFSLNNNVGFYDSPSNHLLWGGPFPGGYHPIDYYTGGNITDQRWNRHKVELGLPNGLLEVRQIDRLNFWRRAASQPTRQDPTSGYTPFTLADDIELRMYSGQNYPWIFSRFEKTTQLQNFADDKQFLRTALDREESNEYLDQLPNFMMLYDSRHRLTLFNGARNEQIPPWLRWRWFDGNGIVLPPNIVQQQAIADGLVDANNNGLHDYYEFFLDQSNLKLDLRERYLTRDELINLRGNFSLRDRLAPALLLALSDGTNRGSIRSPAYPGELARSYVDDYGAGDLDDINDLRRLAAGYAANILAYRDWDWAAPLYDDPLTINVLEEGAVELPEWGPEDNDPLTIEFTQGVDKDGKFVRFLGMEVQPFLLEAFIGHLYEVSERVPGVPLSGPGYTNSGDKVIVSTSESGGSPTHTTIVAVQIANPHNKPMVLYDPTAPIDAPHYEVEVFGDSISLRDVAVYLHGQQNLAANEPFVLPPSRDDRPTTMILYAIEEGAILDSTGKDKWLDFLDLLDTNHPLRDDPNLGQPGTILVDVLDTGIPLLNSTRWSTDRDDYDDPTIDEGKAIRLVRVYGGLPGPPSRVVVDRIDEPDDPEFLDELQGLPTPGKWNDFSSSLPAPAAPPTDAAPSEWIPTDQTRTHWVQWVSACRAWGNDFMFEAPPFIAGTPPSTYTADERNPRYVFADKIVRSAGSHTSTAGILDPRTTRLFQSGNSFSLADDPERDPSLQGQNGDGSVTNIDLAWFTTNYRPAWEASDRSDQPRKPTFFDMNWWMDPANSNNPANTYANQFPPQAAVPQDVEWSYPDKGWYGDDRLDFSMQMLQKDADFERIGELRNVFLCGHELEFTDNVANNGQYTQTLTTFSEFMANPILAKGQKENRYSDNRLVPGPVIGWVDTALPDYLLHPLHAVPNLPAGARVFDAFVCDGPGFNYNSNVDPLLVAGADQADPGGWGRFNNASGFSGHTTPGLVNINTAPPEVMSALPHSNKLLHEIEAPGFNPLTAFPFAIMQYRERFFGFSKDTNPFDLNLQYAMLPKWGAPDYHDRTTFTNDDGDIINYAEIRGERGFASIGELLLLERRPSDPAGTLPEQLWPLFSRTSPAVPFNPANADERYHYRESWDIGFAASDPFSYRPDFFRAGHNDGLPQSTRLSTDLDEYDWQSIPAAGRSSINMIDEVAADLEEQNLIFDGVSNLVTTRSDMFTIYFKIRSFRQNPSGPTGQPIWDATDPEFVVDESRYVMLVDRSEVNSPTDKPKILYLEKLPN